MQLTLGIESAILEATMLQCHSLREITWQHPSQWRAVTTDDRPIYVRHKWGELSVSIGPPGGCLEDAQDAAPIFKKDVGHRHDSQIDWADVARVAGIVLVDAPCPAR